MGCVHVSVYGLEADGLEACGYMCKRIVPSTSRRRSSSVGLRNGPIVQTVDILTRTARIAVREKGDSNYSC